ncbi:MAG TPA: hypothetical protein VM925_26540, partial [Labilithrix sp.]|nr:hypothetical protein [Labilithrix sp.]
MKRTTGALLLAAVLAAAGCGDRPDVYDAPIGAQAQAFGLVDRVALLDAPANRVALLTPRAGQALDRSFVPIGKG